MHRGLTQITANRCFEQGRRFTGHGGSPGRGPDDGASSDHDRPGHGLTGRGTPRTLPNHNVVIPVCGSERAR